MADETLGTAQVEIVASLEGLRDGLQTARESVGEAMDTIGERVSETGRVFESVLDSAGSRLIGAIADTGRARDAWLSLGDAALGLAQDIEQVILELTILNPLLNALFGGGAGGPLPTIGGSPIGDLFSALGASIAGSFASGGEFEVGGSGGIDSQLVAFRATPGERVRVDSARDRGAAGGAAITNVEVHNYSGDQARVSQRQNNQGGKDVTVVIGEAMARDVRSNGPLGRAMRQHYGASAVPIQR